MHALQISYRILRDCNLFRLELSAFSPFCVEFLSIYVEFASDQKCHRNHWEGGQLVAYPSVEPDCRLVFIGLASASRCKVGLLVF